jgi:aminopeptidase N
MIRLIAFVLFIMSFCLQGLSQQDLLATRQDSIRGSITPEREWWDVLHYNITVEPDYLTKNISGVNEIKIKAIAKGQRLQIDLQEPMQIQSVLIRKKPAKFTRTGNAFFIDLSAPLEKGSVETIRISFAGKPREAVNPPWDGGWIWKKDSSGNPWMSVACQGLGASVWYPCKDHQSDEPDSAQLSILVPDTLVGVGNGRLLSTQRRGGKTIYTWQVVNPINNYNIIPYIGRYINWSEKFDGEKGNLDLNFWVLKENESRARKQFAQVKPMLKCFEYWFGPYPFYEDGFKLVESPHLGMEHQSGIAYGNGFANGYLGKDLSGTGWGNKWDFIIIHESGHEWFGNNITTKDIADMWVHEGFTNYSEALYTECEFGRQAGYEYTRGLRKNIQNDKPLISQYGVNREGSIDIYYKGSNLVLMLRELMNDDDKFRQMLRDMNREFYHQTVTSVQVERYIAKCIGRDLSKVFDQYLRTTQIPVFEYQLNNGKLRYRWTNCISDFNMPIRIEAAKTMWLQASTSWQEIPVTSTSISIDPNFYIDSRQL